MQTTISKPTAVHGGDGIYSSIAGELRSRITSGQWTPGQQITPENELAREFRVCRATLKKSLKVLENEGLLWSRRGKGRFVSDVHAHNKTWVVGVVLFDQKHLVHPVASLRLAGVQEVLGEQGYHLKVMAMNTSPGQTPQGGRTSLAELLEPSTIDGAIVIAEQADKSQVERLARHTPVVWLNHPTVGSLLRGVQEDHLGGAFAAAKHLLELGHRRIALLTGPETFGIAYAQREGVRLAMREFVSDGRSNLTVLYSRKAFTVQDGRRMSQSLLENSVRPTAVICGSDELAIGAFDVLTQAGLKVPDDISMIAWNDTLTPGQIPLPMTTVCPDFRRSSARGARMLLRMMENLNVSEEHVMEAETELIIRKSTTSPRED